MSEQREHTIVIKQPWIEPTSRVYRVWRYYGQFRRRDGTIDKEAVKAERDVQRSRLLLLLAHRGAEQGQVLQGEAHRAEEALF